ncbi:MAG: hypothetical protein R2724_08940 [Bryobacterales bacterium]
MLKLRKDAMGEGEYLNELQDLLLKLAEPEGEDLYRERQKEEGAAMKAATLPLDARLATGFRRIARMRGPGSPPRQAS